MQRPFAPAAFVLILVAGSTLAAQPDEKPAVDQPAADEPVEQITHDERTGLSISAYLESTYQAHADFDDDTGEIQLIEYHAGLSAAVPFEDAGRLTIGFDAGILDYDIDPAPAATASDAASIGAGFDEVQTLSLIGTYADQFSDQTGWFVGAGVTSAREDDADFGDSLDWLATAGFTHQINPNLRLGLGVLVKSRLEDDVLIVPVPQIEYTIDERWSIESRRAGLRINYKASDRLSYGVMGEYDTVSFRLDDSHAAVPGGMATHRHFPLALYADYRPNERVSIRGRVGAAVAAELEILDEHGDDVAQQDIDTAIFGSLNVSFRF